MDDLLNFSGNAQKVIVETAQIKKGTFSDKEGKKRILIEADYGETGEIISEKHTDMIKNYIYNQGEMVSLQVTRPDNTSLYKIDYYYEEGKLIKKNRINEHGIIEETEIFDYNSEGYLSKKKSKSMTYEYIYKNNILIEERWHSDLNLNQIIRYAHEDGEIILIAHYSGDNVLGRKIEYKREKWGFITDEKIYSASNKIVSHFKYEYVTTYKRNWLKRVKYSLHTQNKKREATEVQYRDFKFYESHELENTREVPETKEILETITPKDTTQKLEFDNGIYKGEVIDGEMHGKGDFIFNTGTRYRGFFKNNTMDGKGQLTYISGKVYEGTFANNVLEGPGACKWENGDFYVGEFKNGKMHGKGCYIWDNGNRFEGLFEKNKRTEQGILYKKSELESDAPPEWVNELFR